MRSSTQIDIDITEFALRKYVIVICDGQGQE